MKGTALPDSEVASHSPSLTPMPNLRVCEQIKENVSSKIQNFIAECISSYKETNGGKANHHPMNQLGNSKRE